MVKYTLNSAEYDLAVKEALKQVRSLKPVFIGIAKEFYRTNKAIFQLKSAGKYFDFKGEVGSDGFTKYQRWKNKKVGGNGYPLLKLTGRLEASITKKGSETIEQITDQSLVIGTNVEYGIYHQSEKPRKKIPYRPFLFLDPATTLYAPDGSQLSRRSEAWTKAINNYVRRSLKAMGNVEGFKE